MIPRVLKNTPPQHVDRCEYSFSEIKGGVKVGCFLLQWGEGAIFSPSSLVLFRHSEGGAAPLDFSPRSSTDTVIIMDEIFNVHNVASLQLIKLDILFPNGVRV